MQEVWKIIEPNPYDIPNSKLFFSTRKHGNCGGIAFYVNNSISCKLIKELSISNENIFESLCIQSFIKGKGV